MVIAILIDAENSRDQVTWKYVQNESFPVTRVVTPILTDVDNLIYPYGAFLVIAIWWATALNAAFFQLTWNVSCTKSVLKITYSKRQMGKWMAQ